MENFTHPTAAVRVTATKCRRSHRAQMAAKLSRDEQNARKCQPNEVGLRIGHMKVVLPAVSILSLLTFGCGSSGSEGNSSPTVPLTADASVVPIADSATPQPTVATPQPTVSATTGPSVDAGPASIPAVETAVGELSTATRSASTAIEILDFAFGPQDLQVPVGGQVTWTNKDDQQHTATAAGAFDAEAIQPGESATVAFETAGSFPYICSFHPFMTGTITVA